MWHLKLIFVPGLKRDLHFHQNNMLFGSSVSIIGSVAVSYIFLLLTLYGISLTLPSVLFSLANFDAFLFGDDRFIVLMSFVFY